MAQNENYYDQLINGWTPLDQAITRDPNSELVQLLASNGAELGSYAFPHEIEHGGTIEVIKKFIELGANINEMWVFTNGRRYYPLDKAIDIERTDIVRILLESGSNPNNIHSYPLDRAIVLDNTDIVRLLIDHGANVNSSPIGDHQSAPLYLAIDYCRPKMVQLLIEKGAEVEYPLNGNEMSPLQTALKNQVDHEIIQCLVENGANVDIQNEDSKDSALHTAIERDVLGQVLEVEDFSYIAAAKNVKTLLEYGAKCNVKNKENYTPLEISLINAFKGQEDPEDDEDPGDQTFKLFMYHQH